MGQIFSRNRDDWYATHLKMKYTIPDEQKCDLCKEAEKTWVDKRKVHIKSINKQEISQRDGYDFYRHVKSEEEDLYGFPPSPELAWSRGYDPKLCVKIKQTFSSPSSPFSYPPDGIYFPVNIVTLRWIPGSNKTEVEKVIIIKKGSRSVEDVKFYCEAFRKALNILEEFKDMYEYFSDVHSESKYKGCPMLHSTYIYTIDEEMYVTNRRLRICELEVEEYSE